MSKYIVTYILIMTFIYGLDLIFKFGHTSNSILLATIVWSTLTICDVIENVVDYVTNYIIATELTKVLKDRITVEEISAKNLKSEGLNKHDRSTRNRKR